MKKSLRLLSLIGALLIGISMVACDAASNEMSDSALKPEIDKDFTAGIENGSGSTGKPESNGEYERKVIRTVYMNCESTEYENSATFITDTLASFGGYIEESTFEGTTQKQNGRRSAKYVMRIPAERLDEFLAALHTSDGIHILSEQSTSDEISAAYYDTVTRIATLNAEKDSLTAMLAGFTDYNDINAMLQVQERLYDVIEEIEALQTQLNLYDSKVAMSTVTLSLSEVVTLTPEEEPTFGEEISTAFTESWQTFIEICQGFILLIIHLLPILIIPGIGALIAAVIIIRNRKKKKSNRK